MKSVYKDEKIKETLAMLAEGKSKEAIAKHYNHKTWKAIDMYFRRRGFKWNGTTYVLQQEKLEDTDDVQMKVTQIIEELNQHNADIEVIARKHGFTTIEALGDYMKDQEYLWNSEKNTYEHEPVKILAKQNAKQKLIETYDELLSLLFTHQDKLIRLLEATSDMTLPIHKFKGDKTNKTLGMSEAIQQLLVGYSNEFNITQRDIVEVALADFFQKYGYEQQLKQIMVG